MLIPGIVTYKSSYVSDPPAALPPVAVADPGNDLMQDATSTVNVLANDNLQGGTFSDLQLDTGTNISAIHLGSGVVQLNSTGSSVAVYSIPYRIQTEGGWSSYVNISGSVTASPSASVDDLQDADLELLQSNGETLRG